jgi:hypothetical protein
VTPPSLTVTLAAGTSTIVAKSIETPAVVPSADTYFLSGHHQKHGREHRDREVQRPLDSRPTRRAGGRRPIRTPAPPHAEEAVTTLRGERRR